MSIEWQGIGTHSSKSYTCGFCGNPLASEKAYWARRSDNHRRGAYIYICHHCEKPTFFDLRDGTQTPGSRFGKDVAGIDDEAVKKLYQEARDCFSKNAFTSTVLGCRKLLMHVAVSKGAKEGKNFIDYVEFLSTKGYVPPDAKGWVDHIRTKGNEANHEIVIMSEEEAKDLISFAEMLLKLVYEFPAASKKYDSK
jgi:Domain of unknown function (DUF4145)